MKNFMLILAGFNLGVAFMNIVELDRFMPGLLNAAACVTCFFLSWKVIDYGYYK